MIDSHESEKFDLLENELLAANLSFDEITRRYANFLLHLIGLGVFDFIDRSKLDELVPFIKEGVSRDRIESDEDFRKKCSIELWGMEKQNRNHDDRFAELVRCVLFCFETERRWEEEGTGDATPIFLYYLILKKILPDIADEFLGYFRRGLFKSE